MEKFTLSEQVFEWETPRSKEWLHSERVRFTKKEYELIIKPKLLFS